MKVRIKVRIKENCYKLIWKWYLTPLTLNIVNQNLSSLCWKCKKEKRKGCTCICGGLVKKEGKNSATVSYDCLTEYC